MESCSSGILGAFLIEGAPQFEAEKSVGVTAREFDGVAVHVILESNGANDADRVEIALGNGTDDVDSIDPAKPLQEAVLHSTTTLPDLSTLIRTCCVGNVSLEHREYSLTIFAFL